MGSPCDPAREIRTRGAAVNQAFDLSGTRVTLDLPAGPYLKIEGTDIQLVIASVVTVAGNFAFERSITADNDQVIKIAASNVSASLVAGSATLALRLVGGTLPVLDPVRGPGLQCRTNAYIKGARVPTPAAPGKGTAPTWFARFT